VGSWQLAVISWQLANETRYQTKKKIHSNAICENQCNLWLKLNFNLKTQYQKVSAQLFANFD
jgi:hypothetical protein